MKKYLAYYSLDDFVIVRELNDSEYLSYKSIREDILLFLSLEELFELVKLNIYEFWKTLVDITEKYRLRMILTTDEIHDPAIILNQKVANILTSFRTYDDHIRKNLSSKYVDNGEALAFYKKECNRIYDNYFGYRFLYKLRNYVQHVSLPVHLINYNSKVVDDKILTVVDPIILKTELQNYDKWSTMTEEINNLTEEISIKPIINEFLHALSMLHQSIRFYFQIELSKILPKINMIIGDCDNHYKLKYGFLGRDFDLIFFIEKDDEDKIISKIWFPRSRLTRLEKYKMHNIFNKEFVNTYSASIDFQKKI
ncbi:MAG: hypothetical protein WC209_10105 [Ignavibacteriaceae bacterium]|jgi:hypothetical protein